MDENDKPMARYLKFIKNLDHDQHRLSLYFDRKDEMTHVSKYYRSISSGFRYLRSLFDRMTNDFHDIRRTPEALHKYTDRTISDVHTSAHEFENDAFQTMFHT